MGVGGGGGGGQVTSVPNREDALFRHMYFRSVKGSICSAHAPQG